MKTRQGRGKLNRAKLIRKALAMGIFVPENISTLRLESLIIRTEADIILRKKFKNMRRKK